MICRVKMCSARKRPQKSINTGSNSFSFFEALTRTPDGSRAPLREPLLKATAATITALMMQSHRETFFIRSLTHTAQVYCLSCLLLIKWKEDARRQEQQQQQGAHLTR